MYIYSAIKFKQDHDDSHLVEAKKKALNIDHFLSSLEEGNLVETSSFDEIQSSNDFIQTPESKNQNLNKEVLDVLLNFGPIINQIEYEAFVRIAAEECRTSDIFIEATLGELGMISPDEQDHYVACEILKQEGFYKGESKYLRPILDTVGNPKPGLFQAQIRSPFFRRYYKNILDQCIEDHQPINWIDQNQDYL